MITEMQRLYEKATYDPHKARFMVQHKEGKWQPISWKTFFHHATQIACYLHQELNIGKNYKISVFAKNCVEWSYFNAAIHAVHAVLVPIYLSNTYEQVQYIVHHSDSEVLITESERLPVLLKIWKDLGPIKKIIMIDEVSPDQLLDELEKLPNHELSLAELTSQIISLREVYEKGNEIWKNHPTYLQKFIEDSSPDEVSVILYTSGTTGEPKGVVLTHDHLTTNSEDWIAVLGNLIPETKIDLLWLPMSHIFGWGELGLGNALEFTTYLTTHLDVLNHLQKVKPTIFMSVPAYWEKLYLEAKRSSPLKAQQLSRLHELTGGRLKFCLSGGAGLKKEAKEFFYAAGLFIIEGYGLTECSPTLTMNRKDDFDFESVGKPFPRVQLKLAQDGEILAKGANVFKEYYKNPQATSVSFDQEGWFKTGDLGIWTEQGFLKITGRKKEIIVTSGGKNISPILIESLFKDDPYIEHIVLYGSEHKYLTALVTLKETAVIRYAKETKILYRNYSELVTNQTIRTLVQKKIEEVNHSLASFETIKSFFIHDGHLTVEGGFLTPSLKLRRSKVWEVFKGQLETLYF